jgi:hypothetical protein
MTKSEPILYNTRPLKRGSDELINPRIDKLIFQLEDAEAEFKYAQGHLKTEDRKHVQNGFNKLAKVKRELKLIQRSISNHTE